MQRYGGWVLLVTVMLVASGCSDPYAGRFEVTGKISIKGEPLKDGTIFFVPLDGQGSQANAPFKNGAYTIAKAEGLLPGKYLVRISSADTSASVNETEAGGPGGSANITFFDIIPSEWNVTSKQEITIKAEGKNEFSFDIPNRLEPKSKKK